VAKADAPPSDAVDGHRAAGPRARVVVLAAVVVALGMWLVVARLQLTDPYRPGTTHRVTVRLHGCLRPEGLFLDGRTWSSRDAPPAGWPNPSLSGNQSTSVPGTLTVTDADRATFTADAGGQVSFVRLPPGALDSLECPIR